jgi:hypothetical protein
MFRNDHGIITYKGSGPMKVNFYLNPYLYIGAQKCTLQHPHNFPKFMDNKTDETLMNFGLRSPMCLKLGLYVGYTQRGVFHTHLITLFNRVHSPKSHEFLLTH